MLLYGASGHGKVIVDCLESQEHEVTGIFDDFTELVSLNGIDVLGEYDEEYMPDDQIIVSVGNNETRRKLVARVKHTFGKISHKSALLSRYSSVGKGSVIMHGVVVQSGSRIGDHVILNTGCTVDHDCSVHDFVHLSPQVTLCGGVQVGEGTHIGAGTTVIPKVSIGKWCIIGAGAVITQNLPDYSFVVGVPGKVIRKVDVE